jgi:predicted O-linked N-acetylglucosamine transferase (SPINDLY family)
MATSARAAGKLGVAVEVLETALRFNPDALPLVGTLGAALGELWKIDQKAADPARLIALLRRAAEIDPTSFEATFNLGNGLWAWGDAAGSEEAFARALQLRPTDKDCVGSVLSSLLYNPTIGNAELLARTAKVVAPFGEGVTPHRTPSRRIPSRPLRIGWLTGDFRGNHPVYQNTGPVLRHLQDPSLQHFVYSDAPTNEKPHPVARGLASVWHPTSGKSDEDVATLVRADEIDILLILAGRFDTNRALFGVHRAAPIQMSLHDPATSGLPNIDYIILDRFLVPRSQRPHYSETVIRLPSFYTHDPIDGAPPVEPLPMLKSETITFACFNKPAKINDNVIDLWARLLHEVPQGRLLLKFSRYQWQELRTCIHGRFRSRGIDIERVAFRHDTQSWAQHMATYASVDIALDPFPFSGSTTTFEALWMGIPVVTKSGGTAVSRWTGSMLRALKLDHLIAKTDGEYIDIIKSLVAGPAELARLRASLRQRVMGSSLCNGASRARQFKRLFRTVMCRSHKPA